MDLINVWGHGLITETLVKVRMIAITVKSQILTATEFIFWLNLKQKTSSSIEKNGKDAERKREHEIRTIRMNSENALPLATVHIQFIGQYFDKPTLLNALKIIPMAKQVDFRGIRHARTRIVACGVFTSEFSFYGRNRITLAANGYFESRDWVQNSNGSIVSKIPLDTFAFFHHHHLCSQGLSDSLSLDSNRHWIIWAFCDIIAPVLTVSEKKYPKL